MGKDETKGFGKNIRIGLFGIGLDTYWYQFEGLLGYQTQIAEKTAALGVKIVNAGLVDNPDTARQTAELGSLYISTYALSHTVLPVGSAGTACYTEPPAGSRHRL
jgi:L-arabinose isomerase